MDSPQTTTSSVSKRQRLASLLGHVPRLTALMHLAFRYAQARYTAGVVGVVLNPLGQILLVEHVFHPSWAWGLPGGWLGRAEDPADGLRRELLEETGLDITVLRPLLIRTGYYFNSHLDISFLCRAESDIVSLSSELLNYQWLEVTAMPTLLPFHAASVELATKQPEYEVLHS